MEIVNFEKYKFSIQKRCTCEGILQFCTSATLFETAENAAPVHIFVNCAQVQHLENTKSINFDVFLKKKHRKIEDCLITFKKNMILLIFYRLSMTFE